MIFCLFIRQVIVKPFFRCLIRVVIGSSLVINLEVAFHFFVEVFLEQVFFVGLARKHRLKWPIDDRLFGPLHISQASITSDYLPVERSLWNIQSYSGGL